MECQKQMVDQAAAAAVQPTLLLNNFSFAYPWLMSCSRLVQPSTQYFLMSVLREQTVKLKLLLFIGCCYSLK